MARTATQPQETVSTERPKRASLSKRNRLQVQNKESGYHYRIVNDVDDRVEYLQDRDWEVVPNAKVGAIGNRRVDNASSLGSNPYISVGKGIKATVMRIKDDLYKEDQALKQKEVDEIEETMRQEAQKKADYGTLRLPG